METIWEKPTPRLGRPPSANYSALAEELKKNPGEWALVGENLSISIGSHISSGRIKAFQPAGAFEGTIRGVEGSRAKKIYARYVGN